MRKTWCASPGCHSGRPGQAEITRSKLQPVLFEYPSSDERRNDQSCLRKLWGTARPLSASPGWPPFTGSFTTARADGSDRQQAEPGLPPVHGPNCGPARYRAEDADASPSDPATHHARRTDTARNARPTVDRGRRTELQPGRRPSIQQLADVVLEVPVQVRSATRVRCARRQARRCRATRSRLWPVLYCRRRWTRGRRPRAGPLVGVDGCQSGREGLTGVVSVRRPPT